MTKATGPRKITLPNGMRVLLEQMPGVRSVSLGLWVLTGSRYENPQELGITHFVEHMLFKGTTQRDAISLGQAFNNFGGQFNAFTTQESLCVYARVVDGQLGDAMDLLAEMVQESTYLDEEIVRERNVILEEIKMSDDTPDEYVIDLFQQNLWPDQCLGQPVLGVPKTVRSFRRSHMLNFAKGNLTADRIIITIAGNFDQKAILRRIQKLFANLDGADPYNPKPDNLVPKFRQKGAKKSTEQLHFCIGTLAPPRAHKDRYALGLASTILGGGMGSRLFEEIREKRGLTYCISTINGAFLDAGYIGIAGASSPCYFTEIVDLSLIEVRRLCSELVSEEELDRARQQIISQTLFNQESTMSRMMYLGESEYYWKRFLPVKEIVDNITRVKPAHILDICEKYLQDKPLCGSAVGPLHYPLKKYIPETF